MKTMPSLFKMTDDKNTASETPVVITQMAAPDPKPRNTKKIVIIAVSSIVAVTIILTAILVGMFMFTQGQKDVLKYTLDLDKDTKQEVTADQNENVVQYHVQNTNYEMWVVNDFNRDIQVLKIQTEIDTNCYAVPLNRTSATDPSKVKAPSNVDAKQNVTDKLYFDVASTPIPDASFLGKTAKETCKGTSVYWKYPKCKDGPNAMKREKRDYSYWDGCYHCYCYYDCIDAKRKKRNYSYCSGCYCCSCYYQCMEA